jgi:hypothetical protein
MLLFSLRTHNWGMPQPFRAVDINDRLQKTALRNHTENVDSGRRQPDGLDYRRRLAAQ